MAHQETTERILYKDTEDNVDCYRKRSVPEEYDAEKEFEENRQFHEIPIKKCRPFQRENEAFEAMEEIRKVEEAHQKRMEGKVQKKPLFQRGKEAFKADTETQRIAAMNEIKRIEETQKTPDYRIDLEEISSDEGEKDMLNLPTQKEEEQLQETGKTVRIKEKHEEIQEKYTGLLMPVSDAEEMDYTEKTHHELARMSEELKRKEE